MNNTPKKGVRVIHDVGFYYAPYIPKELEMKTRTEFLNEQKQGTFVGVRFSEKTQTAINKYIADMNIPNPINSDELHTTIIYSRKPLPTFVEQGMLDEPIIGRFDAFEVWPTKEGGNALVMKYDCAELHARHNEIMNNYDATYDFPEYKVHLTLSYDIGDEATNLPDFIEPIEIVSEYQEELNLDWAKSS